MPISRTIAALAVSCTIILAPASAPAGNTDPIVLVHGFLGWGPDELLGLKYWGGPQPDIAEDLRKQGHNVQVAVVGPLSSNWDRAVELYAQLTGGCADYGAAHAAKHGHERKGRCYAKLVPQWDDNHKIHLVGHSMGGTTATMLVHLLANGAPDEVAATGNATSPLFTGGKHWVRSVTTLASPHNGTPFADDAVNILVFTRSLAAALLAVAGASDNPNLYDLKLDQWGLRRQQGESFRDYLGRVTASKIGKTHDFSDTDLSTDGAAVANQLVRTVPDVTYFSFSTSKTRAVPLTDIQVPEFGMNWLLLVSAGDIGGFTRDEPGRPRITSAWHQNDGVVPTISAIAPATHQHIDGTGTPQKGVWNHRGTKNWDHLEIIGFGMASIGAFYRDHAALLAGLD